MFIVSQKGAEEMKFESVGVQYVVKAGECVYKIEGERLRLYHNNVLSGNFDLAPIIDKKKKLGRWSQNENELIAKVNDMQASVHLSLEKEYLCYWVKTNNDYIDSLTYLPNSEIQASHYQTYVPDDYDNSFAMEENNSIIITPSESAMKNTDSWFLVPQPRAISFRLITDQIKWFGISVPFSLPVSKTLFLIKQGRFSIEFHNYHANNSKGFLPKLYFIPNLNNKYSLLGSHTAICKNKGLLKDTKPYSPWWSKPILCTFGEQTTHRTELATTALTRERTIEWVKIIEEKTGISDFTVVIDADWFSHLGDYEADEKRLGGTEGLRGLVDQLRERGHHVLLWIAPYNVGKNSQLAKNHPEKLVKNKDGGFVVTRYPELWVGGTYIRDYSWPYMREHMKEIVRYCLSSEEGCLNADGLKIDFNYETPNVENHLLHDSSWGVGEEMWKNVLKLIYETAHETKEDCLITASGIEPCLQPFMDMLRVNDHMVDSLDTWYKRARLGTTLLPETLIDADGWSMNKDKHPEHLIVSAVYGVPALYYTTGFVLYPKFSIQYEKFTVEDYRRIASVWSVYLNSPTHPSMKIHVEPERSIFYRTYTSGELEGFYSALVLKRRCLITYNKNRILVTSTKDLVVEIPLPPGTDNIKLRKVFHKGKIEEVETTVRKKGKSNFLALNVEDAGKEIKYYEILLET